MVAVADVVVEFATDDPNLAAPLEALYYAAPLAAAAPTLHYRLLRNPDGYEAHAPNRPPLGPTSLGEAWAFLEWRVTEDVLDRPEAGWHLHGAGIGLGAGGVLLVGGPGAGKSTLAAHLAARGHRTWGDDLVRFAPATGLFSASERSWKLDDKSLSDIDLLRHACASAAPGTFLAPPYWYISPAAIRSDWRAAAGRVAVVVLLDARRHTGPAVVETTSEGRSAVRVAEALIGPSRQITGGERADLMTAVLDAMRDVRAYEAAGASPAALARALERVIGA